MVGRVQSHQASRRDRAAPWRRGRRVSSTCGPAGCPRTGQANTRRAVERADCRQNQLIFRSGERSPSAPTRVSMLIATHWTQRELNLAFLPIGVESDESSLSDVYERARRVGLELCPAEVGPQLRLEYRNQPLGEALDIAMEPVALYSGDPTILTLANWGTGLILIGRNGRSESTVNRISRFVFALPTRERLEAKSSPQMAPTFSEQNAPAVR